MRRTVTFAEVAEHLSYDPFTGNLWWIKPAKARRLGSPAGFQDTKADGYRHIRLNKILFPAHRLAWILAHGHMPSGEIDHINGVRSDNRLVNLRDCTKAENCLNNASTHGKLGIRGIDWRESKNRFRVRLNAGREQRFCRHFKTLEEAITARKDAEKRFFGEFARQA